MDFHIHNSIPDGGNTNMNGNSGTLASYTAGFVLSIVLTIIPYLIVTQQLFTGWILVAWLIGFAIAQLLVQLLFFLHLGRGPGARWNVVIFLFMLMVVFIMVAGSLWIMNNLDYNMMPHEMNEYMREQSKKGF